MHLTPLPTSTPDILHLEETYQLPTYKKYPLALTRGAGCYVWDAEGKPYLDFYGGHCVALLGHCPPPVVAALQQQASTLLFYSNVVYSPIRAQAAATLAQMAPEGLQHVFFCNSGTEANETALKLARTWTGKPGLIATKAGFHGRTLGSLAATWNPAYRAPFAEVLADTHFVPFGDLGAVAQVLEQHHDIAALLLEPIQSIGGVVQAEPAYYQGLRDLCDAYGVALIFDEVQTGVGRTGTFSYGDHVGVRPDLITLAKSLGAGVPVGAVLASDAIAETVEYGDQGSTFGGGMLAMAAVQATLATIQQEGLMARATYIFDFLQTHLAPFVREVRGKGCLLGLVLDGQAAPVLAALREHGVLAGGAGPPNLIRLMPPLNASDDDLATFVARFEQVHQLTLSA